MADITMCGDEKCPVKRTCVRYTTKPSDIQSYFIITPRKKKTKMCEYYWEKK